MKMSYILALILTASCSSPGEYSYHTPYKLEPKTSSFIDAGEQALVTRQFYLNTEEVYKKHIESGQINSLKKWSCFGSDESVNYVNIIKREVPIFRTLATTQKFTVNYKKVDAVRDTDHTRVYTETKKDEVHVESKHCWIKGKEGQSHSVTSEIYK